MKIIFKNKYPIKRESLSCVHYTAFFLGLYFLLMPFDVLRIGNIGSLLRIAALLPTIAIALNFRNIKFVLTPLSGALLVLWGIYTLSLFHTVAFSATLVQYKTQFMNLLLVLAAGACYKYNEREYCFLKNTLILGSIFTVLLTLIYSDISAGDRLTLSFGDSSADQNYINGYLFFADAYFFSCAVKKKKLWLCLPCFGLVLFSFMTGSRGAILGVIFVAVFSVLYELSLTKNSGLKIFVGIVVIIFTFLLFYDSIISLLPPSVAQRFSLEFIQRNGSTGRTEIWKALLNLYADAPLYRQLLGFGLGTTTAVNTIRANGIGFVAHNLWIEQLITAGFLGFTALVWMQYRFLKAAFKTRDIIIIAPFIGFLIMSMSMSLTSYKPMWNCMIMIMIMNQKPLCSPRGMRN